MEEHDAIFDEEQAHLTDVYAQVKAIHDELVTKLETTHKEAAQDLRDMSEEVTTDFGGEDETMETLAAIETLNAVIDAYNQAHDFDVDRLRRTMLLLNQPYFAKVRLKMRPNRPARDVYIGSVGRTDKDRRPLIIDWRSPVAETYYNQETGPTSYMVDGKVRHVNLELRRQFDITRNVLKSYFDTTVAIEDSLLLKALRGHHSEKLRAITATIQREQNQVVRHEDVPVLLVNGIAGSGKTSVMLQRIAFLFYNERENLTPQQVYLFTPNDVFEKYIDTVLPSLGESNPQVFTWRQFMEDRGLADRNPGRDTDPAMLRALEQSLHGLQLDERDFRDIRLNDHQLITAAQAFKAWNKYPRVPMGPRRATVTKEELHDALDRKLTQLAKTEDIREELFQLDTEDQLEVFGEPVNPADEEETLELCKQYVQHAYGPAHDLIESADWLRIDRIGMRVTGSATLNAVEWLWVMLLLTGDGAAGARYVMVDEVQDYSEAQLMVLARYFQSAHFLLLGDGNQAIHEGTATFRQIRTVFEASHGSVDELRLLTSYRSSPEITALFMSLVERDDQVKTASVQREGIQPVIRAYADRDEYLRELRRIADVAHTGTGAGEGLTAIVAADKNRVSWLKKQLGDAVRTLKKDEPMPAGGIVLLDLATAKGLEFDHVVIPDASASVYPDTPLCRRRLYTAVSRAMHRVTLLAQDELSPLVSSYATPADN